MADESYEQVGRSVVWSAANAGVLRLSQFLVGIAVARLISPHDFGVFVVALTIFTVVMSISDIGVNTALIRQPEHGDELGPTVATIAFGMSVLLGLVMALSAPFLAHTLGAEQATTAIRVMALTLPLAGMAAVPSALLTRDFLQKRRFLADATMFLVSSTVLIGLIAAGSSVMALAWSRVIGQLAMTIVLFAIAPRWYRPGFDRQIARRLMTFGLPMSGSSLVWFSVDNLDFMVIGRLRGALSLGYYNLAYNISSWPVSVFRNIVNNVAVPTFARAQRSRTELADHLTTAMAALAAVSLPVSALCLGVASPLVDAVYGHRWAPAAPVLAILVAFGSIRGFIALMCDVLVATGRTRLLFALQIVWLVFLFPAMIVGVKTHDIQGAAWAHVAVSVIVLMPTYLVILQWRLSIPATRMIGAVLPWLIGSAIAGTIARFVSGEFQEPWIALILGSLCGLLAYLLAVGPFLLTLVRAVRRLYGRSQPADPEPAVTVPA
ncbi:MAG TPA: lipopolysaccharide biosynthesis protein [Mycobacteriales bacterium]|nr:lipopolysaccharide biosynthesis protein [Mycobacteriales bacterium]